MHNPFLVGERVYLRPFEKSDAPVVAPWLNDQNVSQYLRWHKPLNVRAEEEFIEKLYRPDSPGTTLAIALRDGDRLIGMAGYQEIDNRSRHCSVGITIGESDEWSKGYGTEALGLLIGWLFETVNLNRVWLHVYEDNPRGVRSYQKLGFREEGRLRQHAFHSGRYWDVITMGLLRAEWRT